jgi:transcription antitermination factor NusG
MLAAVPKCKPMDDSEAIKESPTKERSDADFSISRWYALFVCCNQEKRVAACLDSLSIEHYLPSYTSIRQWKDRRVKLDMPLFPGYLFVRLPLRERMKVLTIRQVVSLVGKKEAPSVISDDEVSGIRAGVEHGNAEPYEYLEVGQRVVIIDGVMRGMEGILLTIRSRARVVISLQSIGRAFVVEVSASCVRPLPERHDSSYRFPLPRSAPVAGCNGSPHLSQVPLTSAASPRAIIARN